MTENTMDDEIKAMATISTALQALEPDAVRRVLKWATERYQVKPAADYGIPGSSRAAFNEFSELFDATNPGTNVEKALVAAYWFQVFQKHDDLDSQELNKELKHLGHPSANITRDLDSLINRSPRLVMQVRKQGTTKQARKRYRLTREGIRAVEKMLTNAQGDGGSNGNSTN